MIIIMILKNAQTNVCRHEKDHNDLAGEFVFNMHLMGCPSLQNTALVFKLHINCLQQIEIVSTMQFNGIHITQH